MTYVIPLGGLTPVIAESAFVAPTATIIGAVSIGERSGIWYGTVVRGDDDRIVVGDDTNIQDACVLHADPSYPVVIGQRVTVGHRAIVHGADVRDDVLIGAGSIVLNGVQIGEWSVVAAGAVVRPGTEVPAGSLVAGVPATVKRSVTEVERALVDEAWQEYAAKAILHQGALRELGMFSCSVPEKQRAVHE